MLAGQRKKAFTAQECVQERLGELNEEPEGAPFTPLPLSIMPVCRAP